MQITGINTVVDYAPKILMTAGLEIRNALLQTSLIGLVNFAFTFIAVWLIDRLGRKTFYIIGSSGMAATLLLIAIAFHFEVNPIFTTICIMVFIAFFASCIGPAFWTLVAEMFPNRIRGQAVALASFTQWVFNFLVVLFFPYVLDALGGSVYLPLPVPDVRDPVDHGHLSCSRKPRGKAWKRLSNSGTEQNSIAAAALKRSRTVLSEIGIGFCQIQLFDPDIAVKDIVTFGLKFQTLGRIGDSLAPIVSAIDS